MLHLNGPLFQRYALQQGAVDFGAAYARAAGVYVDVLIDDDLDLPAKLPAKPKHTPAEREKLFLEQQPRVCGKDLRHSLGRCVCAVRGTERIVHVQVVAARERSRRL